jgi:hypothetical protein
MLAVIILCFTKCYPLLNRVIFISGPLLTVLLLSLTLGHSMSSQQTDVALLSQNLMTLVCLNV